MADTMAAKDTRLPVTLLTGFLGVGKTTLLNTIIAQPTGPRIAVIVNEFGEAGLDHDLIKSVDEEVVLMKSGCLCCSIRGDLWPCCDRDNRPRGLCPNFTYVLG